MFSTQSLLALGVGAFLSIAIPVAAVIIFKKKHRDSWLPSAFIGAITFVVFALILESLLHNVMLPLVQDNIWTYAVYGALAAGIFEETGRFVAYKTLMRKHLTTKNSVLMGLGHGGVEAIIVLGSTLVMFLVLGIMANSVGLDKAVETVSNGSAETAEAAKLQLSGVVGYSFLDCALSVYERVVAIALHTSMSVFVYKAVTQKGKLWLYPAAIIIHALSDFPVALYQKGVLDMWIVYVIFTAVGAAAVVSAVIMSKKLKDQPV